MSLNLFKILGARPYLPNVKEVNSPYYSYTKKAFEYAHQFEEDKDLDAYKKKISAFNEKNAEKLISAVKLELAHTECDILFAYLYFLDLFSHLWFQDKDKLYSLHRELEEYVGNVLKMLRKDIHVIIISDHGFDFKINNHSNFGFISR